MSLKCILSDIAYITFSKASEAALAIERTNGKILEGCHRPCKVSFSVRDVVTKTAIFLRPAFLAIKNQLSFERTWTVLSRFDRWLLIVDLW